MKCHMKRFNPLILDTKISKIKVAPFLETLADQCKALKLGNLDRFRISAYIPTLECAMTC